MLFAVMVGGLALGLNGCLSGCGSSDKPLISTEKETSFNPIPELIGELTAAKGGTREDALIELQRAHDAGELQKLDPMELQKLTIQVSNMVKTEQGDIRREAKKLLALLQGGGEAAPQE